MKNYALSYSGKEVGNLKLKDVKSGTKLGNCIALSDGMLLVDKKDGKYYCNETKKTWEQLLEWDFEKEKGKVIGYVENERG